MTLEHAAWMVAALSVAALCYAGFDLLRTWKGPAKAEDGHRSVTAIGRSNFALGLVALEEPGVQKLLDGKPSHLYLELIHTGNDLRATLSLRRESGRDESAEIDLKSKPARAALVKAMARSRILAGGNPRWRKKPRTPVTA